MATTNPKTTLLILSLSNKISGVKLLLIGYCKLRNDVLDRVKVQSEISYTKRTVF